MVVHELVHILTPNLCQLRIEDPSLEFFVEGVASWFEDDYTHRWGRTGLLPSNQYSYVSTDECSKEPGYDSAAIQSCYEIGYGICKKLERDLDRQAVINLFKEFESLPYDDQAHARLDEIFVRYSGKTIEQHISSGAQGSSDNFRRGSEIQVNLNILSDGVYGGGGYSLHRFGRVARASVQVGMYGEKYPEAIISTLAAGQ